MPSPNNLAEIIQDFDIYGFKDGGWREFEKNIEYEAFLVRRKLVNSNYEKKDINTIKNPVVHIDKSLDKYKGKVSLRKIRKGK